MSAKTNRKAYFFSGSSALLLLIFAVMYQQRGISLIDEMVPFLTIVILTMATVLPFLGKHWRDETSAEASFSNFADLKAPPTDSFSFEVPSLPSYKKIQLAPARLAASLAVLLVLLTFAGGSIISNMLASDIPFVFFGISVAFCVLVFVLLIALFIAATMKELRLRRSFQSEVIEGITANGYKPVIEFNAEYTVDRSVLLGDGKDHYYWWGLTFNGAEALMEWEDTRSIAVDTDPNKKPHLG